MAIHGAAPLPIVASSNQVSDTVLASLKQQSAGQQLGRGGQVEVVVALFFPVRRLEPAQRRRRFGRRDVDEVLCRIELYDAVGIVVVGGRSPSGGSGLPVVAYTLPALSTAGPLGAHTAPPELEGGAGWYCQKRGRTAVVGAATTVPW